MTLRTRLAIGLVSIAVVLLTPLLLALHALRTAEASARSLRDTEFAASVVVGRMRQSLEDIRSAENALLFVHDPQSRTRMHREIDSVQTMAANLSRYGLAESAPITRSLATIRAAADTEYAAATAGRASEAERVSSRQVLPALSSMQQSIGRAELTLGERTRRRVAETAEITDTALRSAGGALAIAALLALVLALWLARSISRPVRALEHGMHAVAEGDFDHRLPFGAARPDEFGRLAASYDSMARQLAELDKLKAEFISVASHELKTPINVIGGYLALLREGIYGDLTPKQREILATIEKQNSTLTRLVHQLLDVSRFEAGGGRIDPRRMKLARFVHQLETAFHVLAMQRGVELRIERHPGLPDEVSWDELRMNEVIGNMLSNAFKFTPHGGNVTLTVEPVDSSVRIGVRDTGAGIPAEQLPHIFEKFYQADNQAASAVRGTGLGLAIAKQIVDAHRGTITVDSIENVGTTFVVTLPANVVSVRSTSGKRRSTDLAT